MMGEMMRWQSNVHIIKSLRLCVWILVSGLGIACSADAGTALGSAGGVDDGVGKTLPTDYNKVCNDEWCDFELQYGEPPEHGAPTWHPADGGLLFADEWVRMIVEDPYAGHEGISVNCYDVNILGFGAHATDVRVKANFWPAKESELSSAVYDPYGEISWDQVGSLEGQLVRNVVSDDWNAYAVQVAAPTVRGILVFELEKQGAGDYVLYHMEVSGEHNCDEGALELR